MDHVTLYEQLVSDATLSPDVSTIGNNSVIVDGIMRGMVKEGRVVLSFDADRVTELVAQKLGAVYEANAAQSWLAVDAGVDEATFRELFSESTADRNVQRAAIDKFVRGIAAEISTLPELSNPDWDTYSMVAEVSDGIVKALGFRYTHSGPPVPTEAPENDDLFWDLHNKKLDDDGNPWDVVLVKVDRDATMVKLSFATGETADMWRVNPENTGRLAEALRWFPGELPGKESTATVAEIWRGIAADILAVPELSNPDWDTLSMVAEVSDYRCDTTAYRYTESGPPVSTDEPDTDDRLWELREITRGTNGEAWDVALVKFKRDTASLVIDFLSGEAADRWRADPQTTDNFAESIRPRAEDFEAVEHGEDIVEPADS